MGDEAGDLKVARTTTHSPSPNVEFVLSAPSPASAFGVRCAPRTAIPLKSRYPLSVQAIEACGAQKQRELRASAVGGFGLRTSASRKSTVQPTAPCPPHCGSAFAPPRLPSPAAILAGLAECQPAEYALFGGRATGFSWVSKFFRAPAVGKWQPLPPFFVRALAEISFKRVARV